MRLSPLQSGIGVAVLAILMVGAGIAGAVATTNTGAASTTPDRPFTDNQYVITLSASGEVDAEPDQAIIRLTVESRDDEITVARSDVASRVEQLRTGLSEAGVTDDQIRTTGFRITEIHPDPRKPTDQPTETVYVAAHRLEIRLDEIDRAGEIIDIGVTEGGARIDGVHFTLAEETEAALRQQALREATENAQGEADAIADAASVTITGVRTISTGHAPVSPVQERVLGMPEGGDGSTTIDPGPVTIRATVTVQYDIVNNS